MRPAALRRPLAPPKPDSARGAWIGTFLLAAVVGGCFYLSSVARRVDAPPPLPTGGARARWFHVVRLPAITSQHESGIETMTRRYADWLNALARAGYRPVTFSDVNRAIRANETLPEKSVVMLFDPGYRRTLDILSPIFRAARWRGVWMSDDVVMRGGHREFITYHQARGLARDGWWDVGLKQEDGHYLFPEANRGDRFTLGRAGQPAWVATRGARSLNRLRGMDHLTRLNAIADWTPEDLVNRLDAETPVEEASFLTAARVQHLIWGTSKTQARGGDARFDLDALPERTAQVISWFGTEGVDNARVTATGRGLVGSLALRFRWDDERGEGVQVVIAGDAVTVQERRAGEGRTLLRLPRAVRKDFTVTATVQGATLEVSVDGGKNALVALAAAGTERGFFQINVFDRIRDVARVKGLSLAYEPL